MDEEINTAIHDIRNPINSISINAELGLLLLEKSTDNQRLESIFMVVLRECKNCAVKLDELKMIADKRSLSRSKM